MCRAVWELGRIDFQHHLFPIILYSCAVAFSVSNPRNSDLRENLVMAMNLIWVLLAFLSQVCLFLLDVLHISILCLWVIPL